MYEVELKVRTAHDPVRNRLAELGADHSGTVVQTDTYYDAPHRDFAESDEALRIREESVVDGEDAVFLTYKGPLVDDTSKTREEAETRLGDLTEARTILSGLGFDPAATVRKERDLYALAGCTVTLDTVDGLGEFVEVETETDDDVAPAREEVTSVLERLGLDPSETIRTSYLGLLIARRDTQE
ncbi:MAG: adenylate cyclase class 2 [Haloarculaceae archaeon]|jgi:adenylate cyclase class 2